MPTLRILKTPGYVYDLLYIFFFHFNKDQYAKLFATTEEECRQVERTLEIFSPCSDDLYVFFHAIDHGRCLASKQYFSNYIEELACDPPAEFFINCMTEKDELVRRVFKFYFYQYSENEISEILHTPDRVFDTVKHSDYSDTEKLKLYEFFLNPDHYAGVLKQELVQKNAEFSAYYAKNFDKITQLFDSLSYETLAEKLPSVKKMRNPKSSDQPLYLSFCLLNDRHHSIYLIKDKNVQMLGVNNLNSLDELGQWNVNLVTVGNALYDENRLKMLDMMLKNGRITCKDLERTFNFSGSTAYHHLMILTKSHLVTTEPEGKIVYYRINPKAVRKTIEQLERFLTATI